MAKICFICGEIAGNKVENKKMEKVLARLIAAENVKEFYMFSTGAFAAAAEQAIKQVREVVCGVRLHAKDGAPARADVVLYSGTAAEAARDETAAPLLASCAPPRLVCLG